MGTILIAPDSFKECLSAIQIAEIIENASKSVSDFEVFKLPLSDGGDGFLEIIQHYLSLEEIKIQTFDSLMRSIESSFLYNKKTKTVYIESANTIGLHLLNAEEKNPTKTTTYGLGIIIKAALNLEPEHIFIGLGGSSTNDAGAGMLEALGSLFSDKENKKMQMTGGKLSEINSIDLSNLDSRIKYTKFVIACDVENVLFGKNGAAHTYSAQKGATNQQVEVLDEGSIHFNNKSKEFFHKDLSRIIGGGAAGGLGACFSAFFDAELKSGFQIISEFANLEQHISDSDIIITAEGKIDKQSVQGKLIGKLSNLAKKHNKKLIVITGWVGEEIDEIYNCGVNCVFSIQNKPMSIHESFERAEDLLYSTAQNIFRLLSKI